MWCADGNCRIPARRYSNSNIPISIDQITAFFDSSDNNNNNNQNVPQHLKYNISKDVMDSIIMLFNDFILLSHHLINRQIDIHEFIKHSLYIQNSIMDINIINNNIGIKIIKDIIQKTPHLQTILHNVKLIRDDYITKMSLQFNTNELIFDTMLKKFYNLYHISQLFLKDNITNIQYNERKDRILANINRNQGFFNIISNQDPTSTQIITSAYHKASLAS